MRLTEPALGCRRRASYIDSMETQSPTRITGHILPSWRRGAAALMLLGLAVGWPGLTATADQNDPRLDGLFAELKRTASMSEAETIIAEIWLRWTAFDTESAAI